MVGAMLPGPLVTWAGARFSTPMLSGLCMTLGWDPLSVALGRDLAFLGAGPFGVHDRNSVNWPDSSTMMFFGVIEKLVSPRE